MLSCADRNPAGAFSFQGALAAILCTALCTSFSGTPAKAQPTPVYGASEGRYFQYSCGPGRVLFGLRGSAGILIDSIQAICARVDGAGNLTDAMADGPVFGSNRPQDQHVQCSSSHAVTFAAIARNDDHPLIGSIKLSCTELINRRDGGRTHIEVRGSGNLEGYEGGIGVGSSPGGAGGYAACENNYAVGIHGRADQYLNAFGLLCGPAAALVDPTAGRTLGKRKKPLLDLQRTPDNSSVSSIPQSQRTLGKRRRPLPTGGAGSEPNPMGEQPAGASVFTDSIFGTAPGTGSEAPQPSPRINGTYTTTLTVTDSRCIGQDFRGTWQRNLELNPQPGILIPLNEFSGIFAGPVVLNVEGLRLSQSTQIPLAFGPASVPAPATFEGVFTTDASRFDVRFDAGNSLCRLSGMISGIRS